MNLELILKVLKLRQAALRVTAGKLTRGLDATRDDDRLYDMHSYHSAHTGRYAGRLLNVHNLPRGVKVDVDAFLKSNRDLAAVDSEAARLGVSADEVIASLIRPCLYGVPGLVRCDYSAIEPRVIAWLAGEERMLNIYRAGQQPYMDMGRQLYGRPIEKGTPEYNVSKAVVIGSSYGLSHYKLGPYCKAMGVSLGDLDPALVIKTYRETYPAIPKLWRRLDQGTKLAVRTGQDYTLDRLYIFMEGDCLCIKLPSGRVLRYRSARIEMEVPAYARFLSVDVGEKPALKYTGPRGDKTLYGGLLAENVTQAVARDILCDALVRCEAAGLNPVLHVHDEIVCETLDLPALEHIMSIGPAWAAGLPIAVEGVLAERFGK